jgi:hypothetical protein
MLGWFRALMPKEERFFDLFTRHAQVTLAAAEALRALLKGGDNVPQCCLEITKLENEADEITREVLTALRRTFITPLDRGDIKDLITSMDDANVPIAGGQSFIAFLVMQSRMTALCGAGLFVCAPRRSAACSPEPQRAAQHGRNNSWAQPGKFRCRSVSRLAASHYAGHQGRPGHAEAKRRQSSHGLRESSE